MSKTNVAAAEAIEDIPLAPRRPPEINPDRITMDVCGTVLRSFVVRLPEGFQASDLVEMSIWRRAQMRHKLRKLDRLTLISYDEDHVWTCFVAEALEGCITLSRPDHYELKSRLTRLFEDDNYRVAWRGEYYAVVRKADDREMSSGWSTEQLAIRALASCYPRPLAS